MSAHKKKVLIVITKSNWGGAQRYVYQLATELPKDRFEVSVALGGEGPLKAKLLAKGIPTTSIPALQRDVSILAEIRVFFSLLSLFRKERPDVLHLNSSKIGGLGIVTGRLALVPRIIFTAHGFAFNENRSGIVKFITKLLYWFMITASSKTILVSRGMQHDVRTWPWVRRKLVVVHNAIDNLTFRSREDACAALAAFSPAFAQWLQQHPHTPLIGTIGELHHIKGHAYAIRAMAQLPNTGLVIIGGGDNQQTERELIQSLHLEDRVFLLGAHDEAYQYLKAFDLFILPSLSETFGFVLLEAGLAGVPVVATHVGGIPDIVTDGETGLLVPARDADALKSAMERMLHDVALCNQCTNALTKKIAQDFSLQTFIENTTRVYDAQ